MAITPRIVPALLALAVTAPGLGQVIRDPAALTAGAWQVEPLAVQGQDVPGSPQWSFLRFESVGTGRTVALSSNVPDGADWHMTDDGMLVFWAGIKTGRSGGGANGAPAAPVPEELSDELDRAKTWDGKAEGYEWALFSLKNGQLTRIATDGVTFTPPGLSQRIVKRATSKIVPLKDRVLIYTPAAALGVQHGYLAWDGQKLTAFLDRGQTLTRKGSSYTVKVIFELDRTEDGLVWTLVSAKGPKGLEFGFWTHDGTAFTGVLATDDVWPGTQYKTKIGMYFLRSFFFPSGALVQADGGEFAGSVVRVREARTEPVLKWNTLLSLLGTKNFLVTNMWLSSAASPDVFTVVALAGSKKVRGYLHGNLILCDQSACENIYNIDRAGGEEGKQFSISNGFYLSGAPVAYVFAAGSAWREPAGGGYEVLRHAKRLYAVEGTTVKPLFGEHLVEPASMRELRTPLGNVVVCESGEALKIVSLKPGPDGKTSEEAIGDWSGLAYLGPDGVVFTEAPGFAAAGTGPALTVADVVHWVSADEAIAICRSGVYRLRRVAGEPANAPGAGAAPTPG